MLARINIDFEKAFGDGPTPAWIRLQSLVMQEVFEHPHVETYCNNTVAVPKFSSTLPAI